MQSGNMIPCSFSVHATYWHFMKTSCPCWGAWMMRRLFEIGASTEWARTHTHSQTCTQSRRLHIICRIMCWHTMYLQYIAIHPFIQVKSPHSVVVDVFSYKSCMLRGFVYAAKFILYKTQNVNCSLSIILLFMFSMGVIHTNERLPPLAALLPC